MPDRCSKCAHRFAVEGLDGLCRPCHSWETPAPGRRPCGVCGIRLARRGRRLCTRCRHAGETLPTRTTSRPPTPNVPGYETPVPPVTRYPSGPLPPPEEWEARVQELADRVSRGEYLWHPSEYRPGSL